MNKDMTPRQESESRIITQELDPSENKDGISCIGPESLLWAFREFLQDRSISVGVFDNVSDNGRFRDGQAVFRLPIEEARIAVKSFADHQATRPELHIADYWGGVLPTLLERLASNS